MSRYIDADNLPRHGNRGGVVYWRDIEAQPTVDVVKVDKAQKEIDYWHDKAQSYEQTILKLSLNKAEDAVEVVRCKDCKYGKKDSLFVGGYECSIFDNSNVEADDYCSYGEREEE